MITLKIEGATGIGLKGMIASLIESQRQKVPVVVITRPALSDVWSNLLPTLNVSVKSVERMRRDDWQVPERALVIVSETSLCPDDYANVSSLTNEVWLVNAVCQP